MPWHRDIKSQKRCCLEIDDSSMNLYDLNMDVLVFHSRNWIAPLSGALNLIEFIRCDDIVPWYDLLKRYDVMVNWYDTMLWFVDMTQYYDLSLRYDVMICWYDMMLWFIDLIRCYDLLIWYDVMVYWCDTMLWFIDVIRCYDLLVWYDVMIYWYDTMLWCLTGPRRHGFREKKEQIRKPHIKDLASLDLWDNLKNLALLPLQDPTESDG